MEDEILEQSFPTLGHRIIYAFKASFPEFIPLSDCNISAESQKDMHDFLCDSIDIIYQYPEITNIGNEPDQYYENWMLNKQIPELILAMEQIEKKFFDFYEYLFRMGLAGELMEQQLVIEKAKMNITKKTLEKLEAFGLSGNIQKEYTIFNCTKYPLLFDAWKYLHCSIEKGNWKRTQQMTMFLFGRYRGKLYTAQNMFGTLLPDQKLLYHLEEYLTENGFTLENDELNVIWTKYYTKKDKAFVKIGFSWRNKHPLTLSYGVPGFRKIVDSFVLLEDELKKLIFTATKTCDGCGYCTQLDKTGARTRLASVLSVLEESASKCPLFPNLCFTEIDGKSIAAFNKLFTYADRTA